MLWTCLNDVQSPSRPTTHPDRSQMALFITLNFVRARAVATRRGDDALWDCDFRQRSNVNKAVVSPTIRQRTTYVKLCRYTWLPNMQRQLGDFFLLRRSLDVYSTAYNGVRHMEYTDPPNAAGWVFYLLPRRSVRLSITSRYSSR